MDVYTVFFVAFIVITVASVVAILSDAIINRKVLFSENMATLEESLPNGAVFKGVINERKRDPDETIFDYADKIASDQKQSIIESMRNLEYV